MQLIANRYNSQKFIEYTATLGFTFSYTKRWQVSYEVSDGVYRDYYLSTKPTKSMLRKLKKLSKQYGYSNSVLFSVLGYSYPTYVG